MLAGIIVSAAANVLIVGVYIGKYQSGLRECAEKIAELEDEKKQERKDDVGIRERLRYIEAKINGVGWRQGG